MGVKHEAPKGHLRDLRFLLLGSAGAPIFGAGLFSLYLPHWKMRSPVQPLNEYRAEMALHRRSSTASKRRRASTKRASPKPSAAHRKRSGASKAKAAGN